MIPEFLQQGSVFVVFLALVGAGLGLPISEDIVILASGAMTDQAVFPMLPALAACYFGVLVGDFAIYSIARALGDRFFTSRVGRRVLPDERRIRATDLIERRGPLTVLFGRFLIGFRIPIFATAGALGMPRRQFLLFDAIGAAISAPVVFFVGYHFSRQLPAIIEMLERVGLVVPFVVIGIFLAVGLTVRHRRRSGE